MVTSINKLRETERLLTRTRAHLDEICITASELCAVMERTTALGKKLPDLDDLRERLNTARALSAALSLAADAG